jgi:tRNA A-37 threonylcarbamoyl transferase component Bud32/tetratricopeptide (TPR) repeat protein
MRRQVSTQTPPEDNAPVLERSGPLHQGKAEDPLEAQGRSFWAAQRFDASARAVYTHLAQGMNERPTASTLPWKRALEVAQRQAELLRLIGEGRLNLVRARETLPPHHQDAEELCQRFPSSADLHLTAGSLALLLGKERAAMIHLEASLRLGWRDWMDLVTLLLGVWEQPETLPGVEISLWWLDRCETAQDWENYERSLRLILSRRERPVRDALLLREGLDNRPKCEDAPSHVRQVVLIERARLAVWAGIATEALTLLEELEPGELCDPELCIALARTLIAHDDIRRAFDYLAHIPLDKTTKVLLNEIATMLEKEGDVDGAVYVLRHINEHDELVQSVAAPRDKQIEAETALAMAQWHLRQRRASSALGQFFRALSLGIQDEESIIEIIESLLEGETHPEPYRQRLAEHCVRRGDLYRALNHCRRLQDHITYGPRVRATMRQVLDKLIERAPEAAQLRLESGLLHMRGQDYDRAIEELRFAALTPEVEMQAQQRLALCYYHTGQFALALDLFHAVPLDEEMLEALTAMSHHLEQAGLHREALEAARIIHTHDPVSPGIEDRIVYLTQRVNSAGNSPVHGDDRIREIIGEQASTRYRFIAKIGSGGMGIVYKVFDNQVGTHVALKVLRESLSSSAKAVERFFREARIAASLHHPNIVNIFDYSVVGDGGPSFISMEFVDGPSMREIIESKFSSTFDLSVDDVLDALNHMVQLCDALNATHRQGIIHRDIKPDNLMLSSGGIIKITDFGIVHVEEATFTPTGALIGTPRYMSPEQVQGRRVDGRSDLYSSGVILYEVLVGTPPFISGDIAYQQVNIVPTRPREICPAIPPEVDRLIMKCLAKEPDERHQDARALRRELADIYHMLLPQGLTPRSLLREDPGIKV